MKPTIGRIVHLNLNEAQKIKLGGNHESANHNKQPSKCPAMIVAVWGETCVNLKTIGDGPTDIWVTSATQGSEPGQWEWPVIDEKK